MNKSLVILYLCLMSSAGAQAQQPSNDFFNRGDNWNGINSFKDYKSQQKQNNNQQQVQQAAQNPSKENPVGPPPPLPYNTQDILKSQGNEPIMNQQVPKSQQLNSDKNNVKKMPVVLKEQTVTQEEMEGPDLPLELLQAKSKDPIDKLIKSKENEGTKLYSPKDNQVRPRYDYRDKQPPKYYQDHLPNATNKHIPRLTYEKEFSQMLYSAIVEGNISAINSLLQKGADINIQLAESGSTPLMAATRTNNAQAVRYLITKGADLNAKSSNGRTALHIAAMNDLYDIFTILIKAGAQIDIKDYGDKSPLEYINPAKIDKYSHIIALTSKNKEQFMFNMVKLGNIITVNRLLSDTDVNINAQDDNGDTPLIVAAKENNELMIRLLLSKNANPHVLNKQHLTASQIAKQNQNTKLLALIETAIIHAELESNKTTVVADNEATTGINTNYKIDSNENKKQEPTTSSDNQEGFWSRIKRSILGDEESTTKKDDLTKGSSEEDLEDDDVNAMNVSDQKQLPEEKKGNFFSDLKESIFGKSNGITENGKEAAPQEIQQPESQIIINTAPSSVVPEEIETHKIVPPSQSEIKVKQDESKLMDMFKDVINENKDQVAESSTATDSINSNLPVAKQPINIIPQGWGN